MKKGLGMSPPAGCVLSPSTFAAGLGEFRIRDLNDHINKLLREKRHWQDRIVELGGTDYNVSCPVTCLNVCVCACVHARVCTVCACVHMYMDCK